jgi:type I pantothenate kinase
VIVSTDNFIMPNRLLDEQGLMAKKGFPESYHWQQLMDFLLALRAGQADLCFPQYSHTCYDIVGQQQISGIADIIVLEGLLPLQLPPAHLACHLAISDLLDVSLYLDAPTQSIEQWYYKRFISFCQQARQQPEAYFYKYANLNTEKITRIAHNIWHKINQPNLNQHIAPCKWRADLVMQKGAQHEVETIWLKD